MDLCNRIDLSGKGESSHGIIRHMSLEEIPEYCHCRIGQQLLSVYLWVFRKNSWRGCKYYAIVCKK